jgi:hypothetical protein
VDTKTSSHTSGTALNNWMSPGTESAGGARNAYQIQIPSSIGNSNAKEVISPTGSKPQSPIFSARPATQGMNSASTSNMNLKSDGKDQPTQMLIKTSGVGGTRNLVMTPLNKKSVHLRKEGSGSMMINFNSPINAFGVSSGSSTSTNNNANMMSSNGFTSPS